MKTIGAGLMLLLVFLITDNSFAHQEHCAKDFWGNCQDSPRRHDYHYRHCVKDFWGRCSDGRPRWRHGHHHHQHYHRHHQHHHHQHRHRHRQDYDRPHDEIDRGAFCHPRRRVVGDEKSSKEKARRAADNAWMGAVRYDHGERFQDLNHAKDVRHNCDPSSTSSVLKRVHFRCVVEATPCRAPTGSTEERVERRYEVEPDDDKD